MAASGENNGRWKGGNKTLTCQVCGSSFVTRRPSEKRKTCSRKCRGLFIWATKRDVLEAAFSAGRRNDHFLGCHHSKETKLKISALKYNGKERIVKGGYVMVYRPDHPSARCGRVPEQNLIMEKHIGRYLSNGEVVHHINSNKTDNAIGNLLLCSNSYHHYLHGIMCGLWTWNRHTPERDEKTGQFKS